MKDNVLKLISLREELDQQGTTWEDQYIRRNCNICGKTFKTYSSTNFLCKICSHGHGAYSDQDLHEAGNDAHNNNVLPLHRGREIKRNVKDTQEETILMDSKMTIKEAITLKSFEYDSLMASSFLAGA